MYLLRACAVHLRCCVCVCACIVCVSGIGGDRYKDVRPLFLEHDKDWPGTAKVGIDEHDESSVFFFGGGLLANKTKLAVFFIFFLSMLALSHVTYV